MAAMAAVVQCIQPGRRYTLVLCSWKGAASVELKLCSDVSVSAVIHSRMHTDALSHVDASSCRTTRLYDSGEHKENFSHLSSSSHLVPTCSSFVFDTTRPWLNIDPPRFLSQEQDSVASCSPSSSKGHTFLTMSLKEPPVSSLLVPIYPIHDRSKTCMHAGHSQALTARSLSFTLSLRWCSVVQP